MKTMNSMRNRAFLMAVAGLAGGVAALPALAGGLSQPVIETPVAAPAPAPVSTGGDWTGGYVGGALSYGRASAGTPDGNGALYGIRAGYDRDFGSFVLGGGLSFDKASIDLSGGAGSLDDVARLSVRAGADLGNTLLYATAGAARASATLGGLSQSDNGYFGGVGAEYRIGGKMSVGGEILSHRFGDFNGTGTDVKATTAGVNVNFRF